MSRLFLLPLLALLAVAAPARALEPIPPPRGVNGAVLGTAEAYRMPGPMRVCFIDTGLALRADETAWLDYVGIHAASIRVAGPHGQYLVREGNSWAVPPGPGPSVPDARGRRIVRYRTAGQFRYLIYGPVTDAGPGDRPSVWVEGAALNGAARDRDILNRIAPVAGNARCRRRLVYGMFFD
ncbi:MAG: hypothetical protein QOD42_894 [Sphingomonadales bacterium]|nr:hypothetical protein [Sphingomonadales bacterium]